MDGRDPTRTVAPVREPVSRDAGATVRLARRAAEMTLAELGEAVGYTAASLSRMERGKQPMRDVVLLRRVADVLGIPLHLLGLAARHEPEVPRGSIDRGILGPTRVSAKPMREEGEGPVRRRDLLTGLAGATTNAVLGPAPVARYTSARPNLSGLQDVLLYRHTSTTPRRKPTPVTVTAAVDAARGDFSACRYDTLARALPSRIALAQALGGEGRSELAAAATANLYNVATRLCIKLGEDGLAAITADRALTAAVGSGDALVVAEAHRMVSSVWRRQGHYARATDIAVTAAQQLAADRTTDEPQRLSVQGNLYATAAYTAAKQGDRHTAHALIAEADASATRFGHDELLRGTTFGPSQVILHRISISHLLGDAGQAIEHARRVDVSRLRTTERQARYWIDVARAFDQWGKPDRCYRALLAAEQAAPQESRRDSVRTMAAGLMRHERSLPGVRAFADRVGALA